MDDNDDLVAMLRSSAEDFIAGQRGAVHAPGAIGRPRAIDRAVWAQMADLGWLGLALPERLGGAGMGIAAAAGLCEVFGRTLFAEPFIAAALMPAIVLARAEGHAAQKALSEGLVGGTVPFALAWQESIGEVEPLAPGTRLIDGRLHGRKCFVHAVEPDSLLLVNAQSAHGPVVVAVDAWAVGVTLDRAATAQGSVCQIAFAGAKVRDAEPLLGGDAARAALTDAVTFARIAASAQLAGLARGCLDKTVQYVSQRVQFGRAIGSFQSVAHRCVDLRIGVELAEAAWRHAAQAQGDRAAHAVSAAFAAHAKSAAFAAKARCSDVARDVGRVAVQLHGAMGFTEEADIGQYLRAAMQYAAWLGASVESRRRFMATGAGVAAEESVHA